jgi:type II secretory pathway component GspD/PulD (secretin)
MTTVKIKNLETFVLGGLISQSKQTFERRVPVLSKLPLLGQLFRSTNTTSNENELVVLLTPQIIGRDENLGGKAKYETVPVPHRTERLEQLHQMFKQIQGSHFPPATEQ